jgi:hypothetical protein
MVRHQTITRELKLVDLAAFPKQLDVKTPAGVIEEDLTAAGPALRHVMGAPT